MIEAEGFLTWGLLFECPHCKKQLDLINDADAENDDEGALSIPIFNNKWNELTGEVITCHKCGEPFVIKSVEY